MAKGPTFREVLAIREQQAPAIAEARKQRNRESKPPVFRDMITFTISRCVDGPQGWPGFLKVDEVVLLKPAKCERKVLISGAEMTGIMGAVEDAARKRIYK